MKSLRRLSRLDMTAMGINAIVGSSIFLFPGRLALGSIAVLAGINLRGIKPGARVLNALTAAKLLPLLAIALCGLPLVIRHSPVPLAPHGWASLPQACFLAYFAFQGFEVVPVPAGEATSPERDAPFAILASLVLGGGLILRSAFKISNIV